MTADSVDNSRSSAAIDRRYKTVVLEASHAPTLQKCGNSQQTQYVIGLPIRSERHPIWSNSKHSVRIRSAEQSAAACGRIMRDAEANSDEVHQVPCSAVQWSKA